MKYIFFDCYAGFDVQMALGALVDMTKNAQKAQNAISALIENATLTTCEIKRQGMDGTLAYVDFEYKNDKTISDIINESNTDDTIKLLLNLWHNIKSEKCEMNSYDEIKELLYAAGCFAILQSLEADMFFMSEICQGSGVVATKDSIKVIPSPQTDFICKSADIHIKETQIEKEILTSGGAAFVYTLGAKYMAPTLHNLIKSGYGAGWDDLQIPNILRCVLAQDEAYGTTLNFEAVISDMCSDTATF